jgi:SAM-dependent methyltransferase
MPIPLAKLIFFAICIVSVGYIGCKNNKNAPVISPSNTPQVQPIVSSAQAGKEAPKQVVSKELDNLIADFENKDRVIWQRPDKVIEFLGNLENKVVADIGAGTGYFAFRLVPKAKKVIAIDIEPRFVEFMDNMKAKILSANLLHKFETRLATFDDPNLKVGEVNHVIVVNTYHQIEGRPIYFGKLKAKMMKDGKLLIIDFKKTDLPIGPPKNLKLDAAQVEAELRGAGFRNIRIDDTTLDYQYIITAVAE